MTSRGWLWCGCFLVLTHCGDGSESGAGDGDGTAECGDGVSTLEDCEDGNAGAGGGCLGSGGCSTESNSSDGNGAESGGTGAGSGGSGNAQAGDGNSGAGVPGEGGAGANAAGSGSGGSAAGGSAAGGSVAGGSGESGGGQGGGRNEGQSGGGSGGGNDAGGQGGADDVNAGGAGGDTNSAGAGGVPIVVGGSGGSGGSDEIAPPASGVTDKVDLLFVVDNSISMAAKQELLVQALPDMIERLVDPPCIDAEGNALLAVAGECPEGTTREFGSADDLHIGVITTSLGASGAPLDCANADVGQRDNAHLLGSLPRGGATMPGFLEWAGDPAAVAATTSAFQNLVTAAGDRGCGWEASLEAWYRFLIEPYPWTEVVRQNCPFGNDTNQLCNGPETDAEGNALIDTVLLEQRAEFLRPDSVLVVVMLSDENDCSFKATGQSWRLSQSRTPVDGGAGNVANAAYKGSATCEVDPNDVCCHSCGAAPPTGCPTTTDSNGQVAGSGCEERRYLSAEQLAQMGSSEPTLDAVNLRCFDQKRRFGVDYLYPVQRYVNAVTLARICPFADSLDPDACGDPNDVVDNPLFTDFSYAWRLLQDPAAQPIEPRGVDEVFIAGILGVPWQDLAVDAAAAELEYRTTRQSDPLAQRVDWGLILGTNGNPPLDPLMREQLEPRTGTHPVTLEPLAPPGSPPFANSVNGHEWNIADLDDLQYACVFPLTTPLECDPLDDPDPDNPCDCTWVGDALYQNPLCQTESGYGLTQYNAGAYPSVRQLRVLSNIGESAIVTSICPKETQNESAPDFGYRPALRAILSRVRERL